MVFKFNSFSDIEVDMNLWNYLKDMENARGIKFSWSNSNAMNMLLKAVNIECQSLVKLIVLSV